MVAFESLGDEFIERVREGADFSGMEKPPQADCTDPYASGGDIPKDAGEKLAKDVKGGKTGRGNPCEEFDGAECIARGNYCSYECTSSNEYKPVICNVYDPAYSCLDDINCTGTYTCNGSNAHACTRPGVTHSCTGTFNCPTAFTQHDITCDTLNPHSCGSSGSNFACSHKDSGFKCQVNLVGYSCGGEEAWFSCFDDFTCRPVTGLFTCESSHYCSEVFYCMDGGVECPGFFGCAIERSVFDNTGCPPFLCNEVEGQFECEDAWSG